MTTQTTSPIGTAEAFYQVFCALPLDTRLAVARFIIQDEAIQDLLETPNQTTLDAFAESKTEMPRFNTVDALRQDLLT